jgi:hypothetical protein
MISHFRQIVVARRYFRRKNCLRHKLKPAVACYLGQLQVKAALII